MLGFVLGGTNTKTRVDAEMTKLPKVSGAQQRGGKYYFNLHIPVQLRELYGNKAAFRDTMGTSDPKEAERKIRQQKTIFDQQEADKKRSDDKARLAKLLTEDQRVKLKSLEQSGGLLKHISDLREVVAFNAVTMGEDDRERSDLEQTIEHAQAASDHEFGNRVLAEIRASKRIAASIGEKVPPPRSGLDEGVMGLHDVAEKFLDANEYTIHNRQKVHYSLRRWTELHGDIPLEKLERRHLNEFNEALKELPPALGDHRKLSFQKSVAKRKRDGKEAISFKSRETYISHLKSLTAFALDPMGELSSDPFAGYKLIKPKGKHSHAMEKARKPFSPSQSRRILNFAKSTFDAKIMDHWMPILAAYTGAQQEELAQLRLDNIVLIKRHWCIRITDLDPKQKVKSKRSIRTLPVSPVLIDAGFLEYANRRRHADATWLWQESFTDKHKNTRLQDIRPDNRGRFATNFGQRFARKVRAPLNLTEPGMTFHSFRHSWADAARKAKLDPEIRRKIAGRLEDSDPVEADYGGDDLLDEKLEALNAVAPFVAN